MNNEHSRTIFSSNLGFMVHPRPSLRLKLLNVMFKAKSVYQQDQGAKPVGPGPSYLVQVLAPDPDRKNLRNLGPAGTGTKKI